eukprot:6214154-Pleurochrysis_carterae.AAC.1
MFNHQFPLLYGIPKVDLQNYRNYSRSKAARVPSRLSGPTQLNHARLSWRVLTILILYGITTSQSYHPGRAGANDIII